MRINTTLVIKLEGRVGKNHRHDQPCQLLCRQEHPDHHHGLRPAGSCLNWLRLRPAHATRIHGANAAHQRGGGYAA